MKETLVVFPDRVNYSSIAMDKPVVSAGLLGRFPNIIELFREV